MLMKPLTEMLAETLVKMNNQGHYKWVVDDDLVYGDREHPPAHVPNGHWEYVPSLREVYETESVLWPLLRDKLKAQSVNRSEAPGSPR